MAHKEDPEEYELFSPVVRRAWTMKVSDRQHFLREDL